MKSTRRPKHPHSFFVIIISALVIAGCSTSTGNPDIAEQDLIGTWVLTKIFASYPSGKQEFTPEEQQLAITIIILSDKTYSRHQISKGVITDDNGTWSTANGELTVLSSLGIYTAPCRLTGTTLQVASTITDPESGNVLPITLEFSKN